jgi:DNA-binding XRE family transcriptional regulator
MRYLEKIKALRENHDLTQEKVKNIATCLFEL